MPEAHVPGVGGDVEPLRIAPHDDVAGEEVAASPLDLDARASADNSAEDAVSGDHVAVASVNHDPIAVSNAVVAPHPIAVGKLDEDSEVVIGQRVPRDQVAGGIPDEDAVVAVAP